MMLPDDFENTAQSVVATNFFANNVLQAITVKNYWDVSNEYKPLIHTWYVGLLMQFYIIMPLLLFAIGRCVKAEKRRKTFNIALMAFIGVVSLGAFLQGNDVSARFYYLPYRLYEFCAGSMAFYLFGKNPQSSNKTVWVNGIFVVSYLAVIMLLFTDIQYISHPVKLLSIVVLTTVLLVTMPRVEWAQGKIFSNKYLSVIGAASFSIFVWHQVVFALTRYSFTSNFDELLPFLLVILITSFLSALSYKYVERIKMTKVVWISTFAFWVLATGFSLYIYVIAGVVRDVPELDVMKGNSHRGMWAEYCDRGYRYDKDFTNSDKPKWYVIGNSFGRDFVNIILESEVADKVEISYSFIIDYKNEKDRFENADVVFLSSLGEDVELIEDVRSYCSKDTRFVIVGEKNFGENNGQVYRHRFDADYHQLTIEMADGYTEKNNRLNKAYPNCYINMIAMVQRPDGKVPVFSTDGRFISQDCRHLTRAGAQYYASLIDLKSFVKAH